MIKTWTTGVYVEPAALQQVERIASLPFIFKHVAVMPDVHTGIGATVGSVIPTRGAIIPAAVGVDIGCGMMAVRTSLTSHQLPESLARVRSTIESCVPHGRTDNGGANDRGAWGFVPKQVLEAWSALDSGYQKIISKYPKLAHAAISQLGTLGTGNHFIEVCLDESDAVWVMLHSGSRGVGNRIGTHFIQLAKREMERWFIQLPDQDLAYLPEGSEHFSAYCEALAWAQQYARTNRELMMEATMAALRMSLGVSFSPTDVAINCHHNYVARERHFGHEIWVTRKGAVRAALGDLGIIPGSMGVKSYIVVGRGDCDSFHSCSHGAGRVMSRTAAKRTFSLEDHEKATSGVECRKDADVIDETPGAYKDIDAVMEAQKALVQIKHTLKQIVCVKG